MPRFDHDNQPEYRPLSPSRVSAVVEDDGTDVAPLDLPKEITTAEAAKILGCDTKTVLKYLRNGRLEWRDAAAPTSSRPYCKIKLDSVLQLRTSYHYSNPQPARHAQRSGRRPISQTFKSKHVTFR